MARGGLLKEGSLALCQETVELLLRLVHSTGPTVQLTKLSQLCMMEIFINDKVVGMYIILIIMHLVH